MSMFHPFEIAICGFSGSGKTTLVERLIGALAPDWRVGYAKHSGHDFQMDQPGKDTARATAAGAARVFITNDRATAMMTGRAVDFVQRRTAFDDCDCVIVEGWKRSPLPRVMLVDAAGEILREAPALDAAPVLAWVGPAALRPDGIPESDLYLQRDDLPGLVARVRSYLQFAAVRVPLRGLVLAGGCSTRMQRDKASLAYRGRTQLEVTFDLVAGCCAHTVVSARAGQWAGTPFAALPQLTDTFLECGPTGGILTAMRAHPESAWLVVACDLPYLGPETLQALVQQRDPFKVATAYLSTHDGLPEPLCAIYEPRARSRLFQFLAVDHACPRKMLINSHVRLLALREPRALDNVNHPAEYEQALRELGGQGET